MAQEIQGLPELRRRLKAIPKELQTGANSPVNFGLLKSGNVLRDEAKTLVAVDTGKTRDSIKNLKRTKSQQRRSGNDNPGRRIVAKGREHVAYWLEFGTGDYFDGNAIVPLKRKILYSRVTNEIYGNKVAGQPAQPFMRPALERGASQAIKAFGVGFGSKLKRLEKRVGRR